MALSVILLTVCLGFLASLLPACFADCGGRDSGKPVVEVLIWSGGSWAGFDRGEHFTTPNYLGHDVDKTQWDCPVDCRFTSDKSRVGNVDGVIFEAQPVAGYYDDYKRSPPNFPSKFPFQHWINHGYETHIYFNLYADHGYMDFIDINMTFYGHSQVPITFTCMWGGGNLSDLLLPPPPKSRERCVVFMATNCNSGGAGARTAYAKEFMEHVQVDSYGKCLNNKELPVEMQFPIYSDHGSSMRNKIKVFREYKFVLTFENNNVTDYVTEKMMNVLQAGSVPIYMGAPNVHPFWTPGERSIIQTDHFDGPQHLARHVRMLCDNDDEYRKYFEWKQRGLSSHFRDKFAKCAFYGAECRLCKYLWEQRSMLAPEQKRVVEARRAAQHSYYLLHLMGSQFLQVPPSPFLDLFQDFTVSLWLNPQRFDAPILDRGGFSLSTRLVWKRGYLELCVNGGSSCWTGSHPLQLHNWYHCSVVFRYRENTAYSYVKFFVNGDADESYEVPDAFPSIDSYGSKPLLIGTNQRRDGFFQGSIDDVSIWAKALPAGEVRRLVWSQPAGIEEGLVCYFSFDHQAGPTALDAKGALNASVVGEPEWLEGLSKPLVTSNACF